MQKRASEIAVGDILEFVEEGKRAEDDYTYAYKVTAVNETMGGPLFNPQPVIQIKATSVETNEETTLEYHPAVTLVTQ